MNTNESTGPTQIKKSAIKKTIKKGDHSKAVSNSVKLTANSLSTTQSVGGAITYYAMAKGYWSFDGVQKSGVSINTIERANDLNLLDSDLDQTTFIVTNQSTPSGDTPLFTITKKGKVAIYMIDKQTDFSSISAKEVTSLDEIVKYLNNHGDGSKTVNLIHKSDVTFNKTTR
ncbi:hypothetical protein [Paucilactobacillus kaifaensis]|uniref:hypothetical protein n=1 Tax=Paucilactobacillus kaifaensis TaxID=2559921 RepID=UPI0010F87801|nr:hypothetical protein [Paucilactobacillus kaifaensis]